MADPIAEPPRVPRRRARAVALGLGVFLTAWALAAYLLLPALWTRHEHQPGLASKPMLTVTAQGIHGDPINVGVVGSKVEILQAMEHAGWHPADAVTLRSSLHIGASVLLGRAYAGAPISPLFYEGRSQDLAFEKADGVSAKKRNHVRFWLTLGTGREGRPVWLGAATYDRGVGLSHYTGQITHRVGPDLDAERDLLVGDLMRADMLTTIYHVTGIGPTTAGHNGGGDPYFTDGDVTVGVLTPDDARNTAPPATLPDPAPVVVKNGVWSAALDLARRLHLWPKAQIANVPATSTTPYGPLIPPARAPGSPWST